MALKDREIELVATETGFKVHAYWPHAHKTACGLGDETFPFVMITDSDFDPCARCAPYLPKAAVHDGTDDA